VFVAGLYVRVAGGKVYVDAEAGYDVVGVAYLHAKGEALAGCVIVLGHVAVVGVGRLLVGAVAEGAIVDGVHHADCDTEVDVGADEGVVAGVEGYDVVDAHGFVDGMIGHYKGDGL